MIGITKSEFENSLFRQDIVEYYLNMSKEDLEYKFGDIVTNMVGFDQKNSEQDYDLFEHTLRAIVDIPTGELSEEEIKQLKIAAFLHDVSKPNIATETEEGVIYPNKELESAKMANDFLIELGYSEEDVNKICFLIMHINDFINYKEEVPSELENDVEVRKISASTILERMLQNEYNFSLLNLNNVQIKATCKALTANEQLPMFVDEKGENISLGTLDIQDVICELPNIKYDITPTLKDYKMLLKLSFANYKAQSKKAHQKNKNTTVKLEKVRVAAIIEAILPESYKLLEECVDKYQLDGILTKELINITKEYRDLVTMNQVEQMREQNAKNLMNKFNDMKIRLTMK